jgi:uncharacterized protein (TIGR00297 family)
MNAPYVCYVLGWFYISLCLNRLEAFAPRRGLVNVNRHHIVTTQIENIRRFGYEAHTINFSLSSANRNAHSRLYLSGLNQQQIVTSMFRSSGQVPILLAFAINLVLFNIARSKLLSALTPSGYIHAMALGTMLWTTLGWTGWTCCVLYLILGQIVTKIGFAEKEQRGIAESRGGRRGPENVWGSAATSLICALLSTKESTVLNLNRKLFLLGYVAALATKLADTFASEIGKAYGKTTFLITTLERVKPGTEGAISVEGTVAALLGGFLLSISGFFLGLIDLSSVGISTIAAFIATNAESLIGATMQGKKGFGFMTNEVVNFVNTLIGGIIAIIAGKFLLGIL